MVRKKKATLRWDGNMMRSASSGCVVCKECRRNYGSELDGLCTGCRGMTAWEAKSKGTRKR